MFDIRILDSCVSCGACIAVCPARVFTNGETVRAVSPAGCILCGHCVAVCPVEAVLHHGFGGADFPAIPESAQIDGDALSSFLRSRRSVRDFRSKPVSHDVLKELLDIARYAPTASNAQDVGFVVTTDPERIRSLSTRVAKWMARAGRIARTPAVLNLVPRSWGRERLKRYVAALGGFEQALERGEDPILHNAPALIVTYARKSNAFGIENAAYLTYQLALSAHALGLGTCMLGFLTTASRYDPVVRRLAGIPKGRRMTTALVVGWPIYRYRRLVPRNPARAQWIDANPEVSYAAR